MFICFIYIYAAAVSTACTSSITIIIDTWILQKLNRTFI